MTSKENDQRIWPKDIIETKNTKKRANKKINFKRLIKDYYIDKNARLCKISNLINLFDNSISSIPVTIITNPEKNYILNVIHKNLGHLGINRLQYEIRRRGYYWNGLTKDVFNYIKRCTLCTQKNLNKPIKPTIKQILSYYPLERLQLDITYLSKIYPKNTSKYNYLLCCIDHFSKYSKVY